MEDTGITYKTCADSRRSYTMVDWHAFILFIRQLIVVRKLEAFQNLMLELELDVQYAEYPKYVQYKKFDEYDKYDKYVWYDK